MPRPIKNTVDYFPHDSDAGHGRTLSILFNNFGHEGISAWWFLLEKISATENHVIVIRNLEDVEYLSSEMRLPVEKAKTILKKMAELSAIDPQLYSEGKIWSDNLVERLKQVYERRKIDLPSKPELIHTKTPFLLPLTELMYAENTQSKVNKSKVNKINNIEGKKPFGTFGNVFLTEEEHSKLVEKFNTTTEDRINKLSEYIKSHGKEREYKDHYATILVWARREDAQPQGSNGEVKKRDLSAGLGTEAGRIHRPSKQMPSLQ